MGLEVFVKGPRYRSPCGGLGYLLGEADKADTFKDPAMLQRLHDLQALNDKDRDHVLFALDAMLRDAKARKAYA